mmetsp:Transcript_25686/g.68684  ORF Transcript_25686/g.68684 Transcript_25686/m.68684 type:complete len:245 (-) Transcript_25686:136-870(-)
MSESFAAITAISKYSEMGPDATVTEGVLCLAVGDGSTPRTAGLAAFITRWTCVSIDPSLRSEWTGTNPKQVERLFGFAGKFEEWVPEKLQEAASLARGNSALKHLVILCVHSHNRFTGAADITTIRDCLGNPPTTLVSIPCCHLSNPQTDLKRLPDASFEDFAMFSMCRTVNIWAWNSDHLLRQRNGATVAPEILLSGCDPTSRIARGLSKWQATHQPHTTAVGSLSRVARQKANRAARLATNS